MADVEKFISAEAVKDYLVRRRRKGLTKSGILYWLMQRIQLGGVPFIGGSKLPEVEEDDGVGLPTYLRDEERNESVSREPQP